MLRPRVKDHSPPKINPKTRYGLLLFRVVQETLQEYSLSLLPLVTSLEVEGKSLLLKTACTSEAGSSDPWPGPDLNSSCLKAKSHILGMGDDIIVSRRTA